MVDEMKIKNARVIYNVICETLDKMDVKYTKEEDDFVVCLSVEGSAFPVQFMLVADAERALIRLLCPLPVQFSENTLIDGSIAACHVTYTLADGGFNVNIEDGTLMFKLTTSYLESIISPDVIKYMVNFACTTIDEYTHKFQDLASGEKSLVDFLKLVKQ